MKCEWKDGKLEFIDGMCHFFTEYDGHNMISVLRQYNKSLNKWELIQNNNIRKPEPAEPLIMQSGETWVSDNEGISYLWTFRSDGRTPEFIDNEIHGIARGWKSFTGDNPDITELTDEIAKLRPMVIDANRNMHELTGIKNDLCSVFYKSSYVERDLSNIHLATAKELQEAEG